MGRYSSSMGQETHHPLLCVQGVQFQRGSIVPGDFTQQNIVFFPNLNLSKVSYPFGQFEFPLLSQSGDEPSERENSSKSWISRDCSEKDMQWKIGTHQDSIGFPQIKSFCQGGIWEFLIFRQFFEMIFRQSFEMHVFGKSYIYIYHHCQSFLSLNVQIMVEVGG